uniref:Uncharacterized protein n=1 Tax=Sciurus vulgaris TaxID=55149 RepID=A0A8D2B925_SCIVU
PRKAGYQEAPVYTSACRDFPEHRQGAAPPPLWPANQLSPLLLSRVDRAGHRCTPVIPAVWEAEAGGSQVQSQPQQLSEALSNLVRPRL